ncbi:MAG TPA: GGDEF domain-containing protein [Candidatus Polarisedimenticolaceae bacterium]|nr:GGDEF domain-containing protein [Candidatus Polarisedimenticolaceae bacterium]
MEAPAPTDPEVVAALLSVFQHLELTDQLQTLLGRGLAWCEPDCGFALGPAEERRGYVVLAASVAEDDPRRAGFGRFDPERLRKAVEPRGLVFDGLGPLGELVRRWPGALPTATLLLPATTGDGSWAGMLALLFPRHPEAAAVERLRKLTELAGPALGHALRLRAMRELVIKDDTANCFNRRYFEEFLPEELSRASRFRAPLSLIFLDMDNLKEVNRRHGHAMGSRTLLEVSQRVRAKIRKFDKLFRYGGDEFCIVLPETEWHGAIEVAERVREAVSGKPFLLPELGDGRGVPMTASLGVASFPLHARNQADLIERADRAMQRIKNSTKNGIGIAEILGDEDAG